MSENNGLKPILQQSSNKTTIKEKKVVVSGNDDFGSEMPKVTSIVEDTIAKNNRVKQLEKISSTQRVAPITKEKIKLLDYFLPQTSDKDTSFNGVVLRLMDAYIEDQLADRQKRMFNEMYQKRIDELTK